MDDDEIIKIDELSSSDSTSLEAITELRRAIKGLLLERLVMRDLIADLFKTLRFNKDLVNNILESRAEPIQLREEV